MSDYMMRVFTEDSIPRFTTYVGYYDRQVQGKSIHSPKNCLPGAGWEILNSARVPLPIAAPARVNRVLLANGGTRALVYYWYQGRGRISASEYAVKWELMRDAALKGRTEEALVRIVVPLGRASAPARLETAVAQADSLALRVAVALQAEVGKRLPGWASTAL
jgi:EpsI family protein